MSAILTEKEAAVTSCGSFMTEKLIKGGHEAISPCFCVQQRLSNEDLYLERSHEEKEGRLKIILCRAFFGFLLGVFWFFYWVL